MKVLDSLYVTCGGACKAKYWLFVNKKVIKMIPHVSVVLDVWRIGRIFFVFIYIYTVVSSERILTRSSVV